MPACGLQINTRAIDSTMNTPSSTLETNSPYTFAPLSPADRDPVLAIFNHYIANSMAAYAEQPLPPEAFDGVLKMCAGYPAVTARDAAGQVAGFAMLRPFHPLPTFSGTAEITYFLQPEATGQGLGRLLLDQMIQGAREKGLRTLLASISSLNEGSVRFHLRNGFEECGRLRRVGVKQGREFDIIYCQLMLTP